ncbi:MAG: CBS domain-containing protein [Gammaproteobacteria bacterium]
MLAKITVADYMTKRMVTLKEDTDVVEAIQLMLDHKITCAPVVNNQGNLVGMFSERDSMKVVLETAYNQGMVGKVGEFMTRDILSVDANSSILDLAEKFKSSSVRSYPVFEDSQLVGVVSRTDVLKALTAMKK